MVADQAAPHAAPRALTQRLEVPPEPPALIEVPVFSRPQDDPVLRDRAAGDLQVRCRTGDIAYLVLAGIVIAAGALPPSQAAAFGAGSLVLVFARAVVLRKSRESPGPSRGDPGTAAPDVWKSRESPGPSRGDPGAAPPDVRTRPARWRTHLVAITVAIAALWAGCATQVIAEHHHSELTLLVLLCVAGLAAGATTSLAIDRGLHLVFTLVLVGPIAIALIAWARSTADVAVIAMMVCYVAYLAVQGRRNHGEYWRNLATARTLELVNARLAAASVAKSQFLADVSHELRTPMTAIRGFADLLLDGELEAERREYLDTIRRNSDQLLVIINDILDQLRSGPGPGRTR